MYVVYTSYLFFESISNRATASGEKCIYKYIYSCLLKLLMECKGKMKK